MQDDFNSHYPDPQALPAALWARLHLEISNYLMEKDIVDQVHIGFFHRKFREVAENLSGKEQTHKRLADFFHKKFKNNFYSVRPLTELPYQLINANQYKYASALLTNFDFLMGKLSHHMVDPIFEDYELFLQHA